MLFLIGRRCSRPLRLSPERNMITRRDFSRQTLGTLLSYSLLETICTRDVLAKEVKPIAAQWLGELTDRSRQLKNGRFSPVQWQIETENLFAQVDLPELLSYVDFEKLTKDMKFRDRGERSFRAKFPKVEGLPTDLVFGHQMFALKQGRSVVPHGHNNMATAFLVLTGEFHGRHYDRLEDLDKHIIVEPTIDRKFTVGEFSTVSDHKDNVHWFKATSDTAYIFNIHVLNVDPGLRRSGRVYIDPDGEKLAGGALRCRRIKHTEAYKLYG